MLTVPNQGAVEFLKTTASTNAQNSNINSVLGVVLSRISSRLHGIDRRVSAALVILTHDSSHTCALYAAEEARDFKKTQIVAVGRMAYVRPVGHSSSTGSALRCIP